MSSGVLRYVPVELEQSLGLGRQNAWFSKSASLKLSEDPRIQREVRMGLWEAHQNIFQGYMAHSLLLQPGGGNANTTY